MTGRPTIRTDEIIESILDQIGDGIPLAEICRQEGMPKLRTVYDWLEADGDLSARFARARKAGYDMIAVDALRIADDASGDSIPGKDGPVLDAEHVQRSKLRIETRLKLLAKWDSGRYGDKLELAGNAEQPLQVVIERKTGEGAAS